MDGILHPLKLRIFSTIKCMHMSIGMYFLVIIAILGQNFNILRLFFLEIVRISNGDNQGSRMPEHKV